VAVAGRDARSFGYPAYPVEGIFPSVIQLEVDKASIHYNVFVI
jgi:hypothetical protein